jgi:hypothetical protein
MVRLRRREMDQLERCERDRGAAVQGLVHVLRSETAQTLGYVTVQLKALEGLENVNQVHERLHEIRNDVHDELKRILALVDELQNATEIITTASVPRLVKR